MWVAVGIADQDDLAQRRPRLLPLARRLLLGQFVRLPAEDDVGAGDTPTPSCATCRPGSNGSPPPSRPGRIQIGRAHVRTPVTNAHLVCRLLLEKKNKRRIIH